MKILQVNCVFRYGSTGKIVDDIHKCLVDRGYDSVVCYGRRRRIREIGVYKFAPVIESKINSLFLRIGVVLQYGGMYFATQRLKYIIKQEKPDVVHVHCPNGSTVNIYRMFHFLTENKIPTVVTHHAEFFYTGSCGHAYDCLKFSENECRNCGMPKMATRSVVGNKAHQAWCRMKKAFACFEDTKLIFTAVSPWVKQRSAKSPLVNEFPCEVVLNGVNTNIFCRRCNIDKEKYKARGVDFSRKIVFHVTASFTDSESSIKGGRLVIEMARRMPEVQFVVAALTSRLSGNLPNNFLFWGATKGQEELAELYNLADVTLLTSKRETFSMIVAESLCCGTPVVGFKAGGPETIVIDEYGFFVDYGDVDALEEMLSGALNQLFDKNKINSMAVAKYSKQIMTNNYLDIYKRLLNEK